MSKVKLVAEVGCNFRTMEEAKEMIKWSKKAGATATKLQMYTYDQVKQHPRHEELLRILLTATVARELFEYGKDIGQEVFFTPMYLEAVDILELIGVKTYKIRHSDYNNFQLIGKCMDTGKKVMVSVPHNAKRPIMNGPEYLHCIESYPTQLEQYKNTYWSGLFDKTNPRPYQGLSCHAQSITPAILAVAHGATIIEKHVMFGDTEPIEEDWSITFEEFNLMREIIKEMEQIR